MARTATLAPMSEVDDSRNHGDESRGAAIGRRMRALGMNYTSLGREARGTYRQTVKRAIENDPVVGAGTYELLEATLTRLEQQLGLGEGPDAFVSTEDQLIELEVTNEDGFRVVVKGPIRNADVLREQVRKILSDMSQAKRPPADQ